MNSCDQHRPHIVVFHSLQSFTHFRREASARSVETPERNSGSEVGKLIPRLLHTDEYAERIKPVKDALAGVERHSGLAIRVPKFRGLESHGLCRFRLDQRVQHQPTGAIDRPKVIVVSSWCNMRRLWPGSQPAFVMWRTRSTNRRTTRTTRCRPGKQPRSIKRLRASGFVARRTRRACSA